MRPLHVSDGGIKLLKWLGLVLMTGDHVNKYLFNATLPGLFEAGRLCLPIFVFVLAYNLARPESLATGAHLRTIKRLLVCGGISSIPFIALGGGLLTGWWPLNVMFTLLVVAATLYLVEQGGPINITGAVIFFVIGGSSVEYWWPAIALGLAVWWYCKHPSLGPALLGLFACSALWFINGTWWALAALPLIVAVSRADISLPLPRCRLFFYAYYPLHLLALWLIRVPMSKAGYLFF